MRLRCAQRARLRMPALPFVHSTNPLERLSAPSSRRAGDINVPAWCVSWKLYADAPGRLWGDKLGQPFVVPDGGCLLKDYTVL
jgi:hypothetical protein